MGTFGGKGASISPWSRDHTVGMLKYSLPFVLLRVSRDLLVIVFETKPYICYSVGDRGPVVSSPPLLPAKSKNDTMTYSIAFI